MECSDPGRGGGAARARDATDGWLSPGERPELPGPVERTLHQLGITSPELSSTAPGPPSRPP